MTDKTVSILSLLGVLGGGTVIVMLLAGLDDFGYPGSATYLIYENFNRIVSGLLVLQGCSLIGFYYLKRNSFEKLDNRLLQVLIFAWVAMVLGTTAEFWLFSDLPYPRSPGEFNLRVAAFTLFSLGSLVAGITLMILGLRFLRGALFSSFLGIIMLLYLPATLASFFAGFSLFLVPAVFAILIATFVFKNKNTLENIHA